MVHRERNAAAARRNRNRRGFSLLEILVLLAILGLALSVGFGALRNFFKKESVSGVANNVRTLMQRAVTEMKSRNLRTFIELSRQPAFWRVRLYSDLNDNGALDTATDTLVQTFDCPPEISFSTADPTQMETAAWSVNLATSATRVLMCDYQGRTVNPAGGAPNTTVATLEITHNDMVPNTSPKLKPAVRYEIRIGPLWNATVQRSRWDTPSSTWKAL